MRRHALAATTLLLLARAAPAQSVGKMLVDDFKNAGADALWVWSSPFRGTSRDWLIAAGAGGVFGLSMFADQSVADWAARNEGSGLLHALEPVRSGGAAYTGKTIVPPVAAVYVLGIAFKNQNMRDFVMGCATSWLTQSALRKGTYLVVARERPDTSPDNPRRWNVPGDWNNWEVHSFPAGHFANAMSCATFWNTRFDLGWGGPIVYAVAGAIGLGRIADGGHWTSDTVFGGMLGYAVGREVARRSLRRKEGDDAKHTAQRIEWQVSPQLGGATAGVRVSF